MRIPDINLNHVKVFSAVYETRSMTGAAELLHLTQSGVSQHIKAFETDLGVTLFNRVGRKIIPTSVATEIFTDISAAFESMSNRFDKLKKKDVEVEGVVRLGMPIEFGKNVIIPQLTKIGQKYPRLTFEITLDYASTLYNMLMSGEIDFAFVDETAPDRRFMYKPVATEYLCLCASREYLAKKSKITYAKSYFENLEYVEYKGQEPILRRWMLHHLKRQNLRLNVRAHIMDVQGVAKFISCGLGAGVLPDHLVKKLQSEGVDLYVFEGKQKPLANEIRLVQIKNSELSDAVYFTLQELKLV